MIAFFLQTLQKRLLEFLVPSVFKAVLQAQPVAIFLAARPGELTTSGFHCTIVLPVEIRCGQAGALPLVLIV